MRQQIQGQQHCGPHSSEVGAMQGGRRGILSPTPTDFFGGGARLCRFFLAGFCDAEPTGAGATPAGGVAWVGGTRVNVGSVGGGPLLLGAGIAARIAFSSLNSETSSPEDAILTIEDQSEILLLFLYVFGVSIFESTQINQTCIFFFQTRKTSNRSCCTL